MTVVAAFGYILISVGITLALVGVYKLRKAWFPDLSFPPRSAARWLQQRFQRLLRREVRGTVHSVVLNATATATGSVGQARIRVSPNVEAPFERWVQYFEE